MNNTGVSEITELEMNIKKMESILGYLSEVIVITDHNGIVKYESESMESIFGFSVKDTRGTSIVERARPDEREMLAGKISNCFNNEDEKERAEYHLQHTNGSWRNVGISMHNMSENPLINGILINIRDITVYKEMKEKAHYYKYHDSLTGLPNKEMFASRFKRELERKNRKNHIFGVMSIGINKFKDINSLYGISTGNEILQKIGERLQNKFRNEDLVSRFDGGRFLILFTNLMSTDNANAIFRKTIETFTEPVVINNNVIKITASMGICFYPHDGNTIELLIEKSETAMYQARSPGRNTCKLFDSELNKKMLFKLKLEKELQDGIVFNDFKVYYQPKVNALGEIIGMESLVRWQSRDRGFIGPDEFIPLMESNGMIVDLGRFVLQESCLQIKKWQTMGLTPVPVSVNISPYEFCHSDIVSEIKKVLNSTGLNPKYLDVEITETGIMLNEQESIEKISAIHNLGVSVSIDDFGTGYSSLSKLKDYPIDTLKIDKSFIDDLPDDSKSGILTKTIISLANSLRFKVLVEGVEKRSQLDYLKELGCNCFQGYYFSKPVGAPDMESLLKGMFALCA